MKNEMQELTKDINSFIQYFMYEHPDKNIIECYEFYEWFSEHQIELLEKSLPVDFFDKFKVIVSENENVELFTFINLDHFIFKNKYDVFDFDITPLIMSHIGRETIGTSKEKTKPERPKLYTWQPDEAICI